MNIVSKFSNYKIIVRKPFDEIIIKFCENLSKKIMKNKKYNIYPDLKQFGFWCRKKNLIKFKKNNTRNNLNLLGRGLAFHVPPSNVPMNFAYTTLFGLLSGCTNVIRIPTRKFNEVDQLISIINKNLKLKQFRSIKNMIHFIRYEKSDKISLHLSKISDVRLIWGGDETIKRFKEYPTKLKNVDLMFPSKTSGCIIDCSKLSKIKNEKFINFINNFYNDVYTFDQMGCSSPKVIYWIKNSKNSDKVIENFWDELSNLIKKKYENNLPETNKKLKLLQNISIKNNFTYYLNKNKKNFYLTRLYSKKIIINKPEDEIGFGTFQEFKIRELEAVKKLIPTNFQTLTYFGIKKRDLIRFIYNNKINNINRIVPAGSAFNMNLFWDGYDIVSSMTQVIE